MSEATLEEKCRALADTARAGKDWITDDTHADIAGPGAAELGIRLGKLERRAAKLAIASQRKPALAVFGPSQAGKSFLVSVLARPSTGALVAQFNSHEVNYIREINPEGEGEATGLVTRFTTERVFGHEDLPIALDLMTESDVIRCLVNSFFNDGDQSDPVREADDLAALMEAARADRGRAAARGLSADDVRDVQGYVEREFSRSAYAQSLQPYWDEAAKLLPNMGRPQRAKLLAVLWGGHAAFTDTYLQLTSALDALNHAQHCFAGLDALVPRETSIIDVRTLHKLGTPEDSGKILVETPDGSRSEIDRPVLCALTAELVVPMKTRPDAVFDRMDLLDFPGARNRFEQSLERLFETGPSPVSELLLRGKVAYLFDRYCNAQDISGMLLCLPDSNMETLDLPRLVDRWIDLTHGKDPERRSREDCGLFVTLTKADKHLTDSAVEAGDTSRFERRMHASLIEKFGRGQDKWVENWSQGTPFTNCFWLRNPQYFAEAIYEYDADMTERLREDKRDRLAALRAGVLAADAVQRHFSHPDRAWDAAVTPNDGGVSYLLERIEAGCDPDLKARHIQTQIERLAADIETILRPFHVSDVREDRVAAARETASRIMDDLERALNDGKFGALIRALMISQDDLAQRLSRTPEGIRVALSNETPQPARRRPGLSRPDQKPAPKEHEGSASIMSPRDFQVRTAIEAWARKVEGLGVDDATVQRFSLSGQAASELASLLVRTSKRAGMEQRLRTALERVGYGLTLEDQAKPAAVICSDQINAFVATVGQGWLDPARRVHAPDQSGTERPVFGGVEAAVSANSFEPGETMPNYTEQFWTDWAFSIYAAFEASAQEGGARAEHKAANAALGKVLASLEDAA